MKIGGVQFGFKTSIIGLFVTIVLVIGLTLVYLSFSRITAVTDSAASQFIDKVAELSADRIGSQLKLVRDNLAILSALPSVQSGDIEDNPRLTALLAAMLKNNPHLFNLYVGYADGSFIEMDAIDGTGRETRARLGGARSGFIPHGHNFEVGPGAGHIKKAVPLRNAGNRQRIARSPRLRSASAALVQGRRST